jgi:Transposase, Mutator family
MVVCDGLKGLPDAIGQVWPAAITQTCIVHYPDTAVMPIPGLSVLAGGGNRVLDIGIIERAAA